MCNREICLNSTLNSANSSEDIYDSNHDFLSHVGHCKHKVVGLVRQQMQRVSHERKLNVQPNVKYKYPGHDPEMHYSPPEEIRDASIEKDSQTRKVAKANVRDNETLTSPRLEPSILPNFLLTRPKLPQLDHVYEYKNVIVASLVMLGVVWMALVLGALLGASICGDKHTCLPIFQMGSTMRSRHSLF
ncbi:uncharacterized protein LOC135162000 [Diachasmimorpha longicaudata]|uniref:uncharacterized protein LOC135162000 n=1 Tax=Diachasmimorpha longicaudata TaxID=58733 RepID=UPI0030B8B3EA